VGRRRRDYAAGKLSGDRIAELEAISGWTWDVLDQQWVDGITAVRNFVDEHKHARISSSYVSPGGHRTGQWVSKRRSDYAAGTLSDDRIAELEPIPGWVWDLLDQQWIDGIAAVRNFADTHKHARVPQNYVSADEHRTGQWAAHRRREYAKGQLTADRIAELEAIPGWVWSGVFDQQWVDGITAVRNFADKHKHARVPQNYVSSGGHRTGTWVAHRRREYAKGQLTADRIAELEAIPGWVWNTLDQQWVDGIAAVRNFADTYKLARIPNRYVSPDRHRTGMWVGNRRLDYAKGRLTADRIAELEAIPGWVWNTLDQQWIDGITAVWNFVDKHKHARIPRSYVSADEHQTGVWVSNRRRDYEAGTLTAERIAELEAIPGWTWQAR
jgi:hypothetical protein